MILSNVSPRANVYSEETFGPVLLVQRASSLEKIVELANEHETGLSSSIWTNDYKLALDVARQLDIGAVSFVISNRIARPFRFQVPPDLNVEVVPVR